MLESVSPQGHLSIRERGSSVGGTKIMLLISPAREKERGRKEKAQTDTQDGEGGVCSIKRSQQWSVTSLNLCMLDRLGADFLGKT